MKIYQLGASGTFVVNGDRYTRYSAEVYRTKAAARAAMPAFYKLLTTQKHENDMMVMAKNGLHIFINPLKLINNKKKGVKRK